MRWLCGPAVQVVLVLVQVQLSGFPALGAAESICGGSGCRLAAAADAPDSCGSGDACGGCAGRANNSPKPPFSYASSHGGARVVERGGAACWTFPTLGHTTLGEVLFRWAQTVGGLVELVSECALAPPVDVVLPSVPAGEYDRNLNTSGSSGMFGLAELFRHNASALGGRMRFHTSVAACLEQQSDSAAAARTPLMINYTQLNREWDGEYHSPYRFQAFPGAVMHESYVQAHRLISTLERPRPLLSRCAYVFVRRPMRVHANAVFVTLSEMDHVGLGIQSNWTEVPLETWLDTVAAKVGALPCIELNYVGPDSVVHDARRRLPLIEVHRAVKSTEGSSMLHNALEMAQATATALFITEVGSLWVDFVLQQRCKSRLLEYRPSVVLAIRPQPMTFRTIQCSGKFIRGGEIIRDDDRGKACVARDNFLASYCLE